jgi:hypothetical protein
MKEWNMNMPSKHDILYFGTIPAYSGKPWYTRYIDFLNKERLKNGSN